LFKNILLVIASVLLSVTVIAVLVELVGSYRYDKWKAEALENMHYSALTIASDNEVLIWEYRPNGSGEARGALIQTNEHGFRDFKRANKKNKKDLRIAFVGDSVTLGHGVDMDATFVRVFEREAGLRVPPVDVEAMSFAVHGYSAIQVLELLRGTVVEFSPDIAVYVMCMNDFDFVHSSGQLMKYFQKPESFFFRMLERVYALYVVDHFYDYHFQKTKETIFAEIVKAKAEMDNLGIDFRVVVMPIFEGDDPSSEYALMDMHKEILTMLGKNKIPTVDLLGAFDQANSEPEYYAFDDVHLTEAGHQLTGTRLVEGLLQQP
jgi:lysophospholipase L1-like esterase